MKTHKMAFLVCLVAAGVVLLSAASAFTGAKPENTKRAWTILLYGAVDNSADDPFVEFTDQVRRAIDDDPGIELLLFIDRSDKHRKRATFLGDDFTSTRLYRIKKDSVERLSGGTNFPEITKDNDVNLNSADASTLQRFITWGKANYPAERYGLLIYSHADGRSMCPDARTDSVMGIAEPTEKISAKERVDFLALELCNMGGVEIGYQWRPGNGRFEADILVAIPNAGPPLDWDRAFSRIRSPGHAATGGSALDPARMTAVDFGKLVIEEGRLGRQAHEKPGGMGSRESAGCYDLRKAGEVKKAVDALAVALAKSNTRAALLEIRNTTSPAPLISYSEDSSFVDLYDLCRRIAGSDRFPEPVRSAATGVMKSLPGFMISSFGMSGYKQFEDGKNGVFIVLPSGRPNSWRYYRWYTPIRGDRNNYGNWSFLKDGATPGNGVVENWFELLESWFNVAEEPSGINTAEAKKELEKLQGEWTMVSREMGGQKTRDEVLKQFRLTIAGDEWIVTYQDKENLRITLKIDPTREPKTLDMRPKGGNEEDVSLGIYKLEGDTLTLCRMMASGDIARPQEFKTTREGEVVVVWRRALKQ
jgi:clostripain